jgi:hypothetical protein
MDTICHAVAIEEKAAYFVRKNRRVVSIIYLTRKLQVSLWKWVVAGEVWRFCVPGLPKGGGTK